MTLNDIKTYIIKQNLDSPSRKRKAVDQRMYLYAYIYHFLNYKNLTKIGKLFGNRNHASIRHALINAPEIQFQEDFLNNTKELNDQIPIIIPEYKQSLKNRPNTYKLTIKVSRSDFYEYIETKDKKIIYDILFRHLIKSTPKINYPRNKYQHHKK